MTLPPPDSGLVMPISFAGSGYALIRQLANSQTIATHQVSKYFRYFTPFSNKAGLKLRVVKKEAKFGTFCPLYNLGKGGQDVWVKNQAPPMIKPLVYI